MESSGSLESVPALRQVQLLEETLKTIEYALGKLFDWHTRVSAAHLTAYVPTAPAGTTKLLRDAVELYRATCQALETELLRAQAVLKRDEKRARGELSPLKPLLTVDAGARDGSSIPLASPAAAESSLLDDLFGDSVFADTPIETPADGGSGFFLPVGTSVGAPTAAPAGSAAPSPRPLAWDPLQDPDLALLLKGDSPLSAPSASSGAMLPASGDPLMDVDIEELLRGPL